MIITMMQKMHIALFLQESVCETGLCLDLYPVYKKKNQGYGDNNHLFLMLFKYCVSNHTSE